MPTVSFVHPQVKTLMGQYDIIRDCLAGEVQIKYRREKYLPRPDPGNITPENIARYNAYITRAVFYNVAQRTQSGLVGQVFMRQPNVDVPKNLDVLVEDATGSGVPLKQLAQEAASYAIAYGRTGLFCDYPSTVSPDEEKQPGATVEEIEDGAVRPVIRCIPPWDCINYRVKKQGAKIILSLVVFREDRIETDDGFATAVKDQWRVLRLDSITGDYVQEVYYQKTGARPDEQYFPKDFNGKPFKELPFVFVGSVNNDPVPQLPPMYDLCSLNLAHYRNSADYEENVYFIGQPTPWFAGLTEEWVQKVMGGAVALGARGSIMLPENGSAGLLQVQPNTIAKEAMDQKEAQMLALGAKLVEGSQTQRTATEANIDNVSETSVLSSVAANVGSAVEDMLEFACEFTGDDPETVDFDLNTEFDLVSMSSQDRAALLKEWQAGGIVFEEYRDNLRRAGIATLDDAAAKIAIAAEQADALASAVASAEAMAAANPTPAPGNAPPADKPPAGGS